MCNFDLRSKILTLDNKNKKRFYFVMCSLNRNFAAENKKNIINHGNNYKKKTH